MKNILYTLCFLMVLISYYEVKQNKKIQQTINKTDSTTIKQLFNLALTNRQNYQWLDVLSNDIGGRSSSSPEAQQAVEWGEKLMKELKFDKVWLQPVIIPHWVRGEKEEAYFIVNNTKYNVPTCALGAVRLTNSIDTIPHTGVMSYGDIPENKKVPTAAISTKAANLLSEQLKENLALKFYFKQSCNTLPNAPSFNVIGEITGSEFPEKYITVGAHLDSWDLGDDAHDDGAGIVQSIEVARLLTLKGIKLKHTLRIVLFMNEENGSRGGKKYAEEAKNKKENHIAALESDSGGFTPRGFSFNANGKNKKLFKSCKSLLATYGLHDINTGGSDADIEYLKNDTISLFGYQPDSQRYFDYHHTSIDTFDKVNKRELELGATSMTALVYLLDKYLE